MKDFFASISAWFALLTALSLPVAVLLTALSIAHDEPDLLWAGLTAFGLAAGLGISCALTTGCYALLSVSRRRSGAG